MTTPTALPSRFPVLRPWMRLSLLAVLVAQFLLLEGPVWRKLFDWDATILWSYATVPLFVALALAAMRQLRTTPWLLHTLELAAGKFVVTALFLIGVLLVKGGERPAPAAPLEVAAVQPAPEAPPEPPRPPTVFAPGTTGALSGQVVGTDGAPVADALVFVSAGLEDAVFAPPAEERVIANDGEGFRPQLSFAQVGQPLRIRSTNHALHTVLMTQTDHRWVLNVPVLAAGEGTPLQIGRDRGLITLRCAVHGRKEGEGNLVLVGHPFAAVTGADGRFAWSGVPRRALTVTAFSPSQGRSSAQVTLGDHAELRLALPGTAVVTP